MTVPLLNCNIGCRCGKVAAAIRSLEKGPPLRIVCYCKDCRGYFNTLNHLASKEGMPPAANVDEWGGVDWTSIYMRDITVTKGHELLATSKIRPASKIRQVYTKCCYTPMFRIGDMSVLCNSNLLPPEPDQKPEVRCRIMGRQAPPMKENLNDKTQRPSIHWSVPFFSWAWMMCPRINKDLMVPVPSPLDVKMEEVGVLDGFQEG